MKKTMHMIGNAHIDPAWLWRWQEGFSEVLSTCRSALDRMNETPGFIFCRSSSESYKWIEQVDPGMFEEIRDKVRCMFVTKADHPRALPPESILPLAERAGIAHEVLNPVAAAFQRAIELSEKDGSIVLSAGSMFVTAEAIAAWQARDLVKGRPGP